MSNILYQILILSDSIPVFESLSTKFSSNIEQEHLNKFVTIEVNIAFQASTRYCRSFFLIYVFEVPGIRKCNCNETN